MPRDYGLRTNIAPYTNAPAIGGGDPPAGSVYYSYLDQCIYVSSGQTWMRVGPAAVSDWKQSVRLAATSNITLSGNSTTVDNVIPSVGDRVLAMGQTNAADNGIYTVAAGAWTRPADAWSGSDMSGAIVYVREGMYYKDSVWKVTTNSPITVGTTPIAWAPFGATEIAVRTATPNPRIGELLWVDTDESSGVRLEALELVGGWPKAASVTVPFLADVLVSWSASWYPATIGTSSARLTLDGVAQNQWAGYYFNEASSHKEGSGAVVVRNLAAGAHNWGIEHAFNAGSDGNDKAHIALTFLAVA